MSREAKRDYVPTPELVKDGANLPTTPVKLSDGDWDGLRRLLESIRQVVNGTGGTITGKRFRTAVEPDQRVEIDTANGIRIYNSQNKLTAQLRGDIFAIKTAASGERVEIDSVNGIRIYDSSNTLVAQLKGGAFSVITATSGSVDTLIANSSIATPVVQFDGLSLYSGVDGAFGGSSEVIVSDGDATTNGKVTVKINGAIKATVDQNGLHSTGAFTNGGLTPYTNFYIVDGIIRNAT